MKAMDSGAAPGSPDGPFETWLRLRESQGARVSMIRLYAMVAEPRGLRADELPLAERRALGQRARSAVAHPASRGQPPAAQLDRAAARRSA